MILQIIPSSERSRYKCYECGERRSVKYLVRISGKMDGTGECTVPMCNKCAALQIGRE